MGKRKRRPPPPPPPLLPRLLLQCRPLQAASVCFLLLLTFVCVGSSSSSPVQASDLKALLSFKAAVDAAGRLASWNAASSDADPCSTWYGVSCSPPPSGAAPRRVVRLVLEGLSLSGGGFPALTALDQLRVLSLQRNLLSGPISDLSPFAALKLLFLSHNAFSGPLPLAATSLPPRLYRLDLSHNNLSGPVPAVALNRLPRLLTLRLDGNHLSGHISGLDLPNLQDFNISGNLLTGGIPRSLSGFPTSAFAGNTGLCGGPLHGCDSTVVRADPSRPRSGGTQPPPPPLSSPAATAVVSSSPTSPPGGLGAAQSGVAANAAAPSASAAASSDKRHSSRRMSRVAVAAVVVGDFAVLVLIAGLLSCYFWRKLSRRCSPSRLQEGEKIVYSSSPYTGAPHGDGGGLGRAPAGFEPGKMVFFEGTKRFELEDLLRASAEMLGKGVYGTAYKAVLDDGTAVAVKRLREAADGGQNGPPALGRRREFELHMEVLGRLRHPNLVSLRAYYYARDEKLLVNDYIPDGSLFSLLHGNRGPGRTPLDWATRVRIASGTARGVAYIHQAGRSSPKIAHGGLKSTNVLVDESGAARVADFGLASLAAGPGVARCWSNGYRAPELAADGRKAGTSHKADVYSFGVLLLELLTGKCPSTPYGPETGVGATAAAGGGATVVDLPRWVQSVLREEWTAEVFDLELMRYKDIEEDMVCMLQIAMACTAASPDLRPRMANVVKMIDDLRGAPATSPSQETSFDSVSDSPYASDAASAGATSQ